MALTYPHSQAYDAVEITLDIRAVSGWFEFPGKVTRGKWAATFSHENPQYQQWFKTRMQNPAQMFAKPPRYASITTFDADSLVGRATYRCGDDVQLDTLDLATFVHWMQMLFPDADPTRLLDEAEGILATVEAEMQRAREGVTLEAMRLPISTSAFRGSGGSSSGALPQRLWHPGIAIVAGVVLAIWLYGTWVIARLTKPKA